MIIVTPRSLYTQYYHYSKLGIRIFDTEDDANNYHRGDNELFLIFGDNNGYNLHDGINFNKTHVMLIEDFITNLNNKINNDIIIHCTMGISRSPAIALSIKDYLLPNIEIQFINNPIPNSHVTSVFRQYFYNKEIL